MGGCLTVAVSVKHSATRRHLTKDTDATCEHTGCQSGGGFRRCVVYFSLIASNKCQEIEKKGRAVKKEAVRILKTSPEDKCRVGLMLQVKNQAG